MSDRAPRVTAKQIVRLLIRRGFVLVRSSGSHHIYKDAAGKRATVPVHAGKILHPKTLQSILDDAGITIDELSADL